MEISAHSGRCMFPTVRKYTVVKTEFSVRLLQYRAMPLKSFVNAVYPPSTKSFGSGFARAAGFFAGAGCANLDTPPCTDNAPGARIRAYRVLVDNFLFPPFSSPARFNEV